MRVVVVGSGASAVHYATTMLTRGHEVTMVDVGRDRVPPVAPEESFQGLKRNLEDPIAYFLGEEYEAVTFPGKSGEYYGFPPHKQYVFEPVGQAPFQSRGFEPLVSFARGGLAETWTAGVFPFESSELEEFPFSLEELLPHYETVARRIGVSGTHDDLAQVIPYHDHVMDPLPLDEHSSQLLSKYRSQRAELLRDFGFRMGRSRVATLSQDHAGRPACKRLGRCLAGCPIDALYTPRATLLELVGREGFRYVEGRFAKSYRLQGKAVRSLVVEPLSGGEVEEIELDRLVLGAGTLSSARLLLQGWRDETGESVRLNGLMDNRQILMPFLNWGMIRRAHDPDTYQYHQLTAAIGGATPLEHVHALVTTLKTASIHPIVQRLPLDLRTASRVFRNVHAALGLVNVNFADNRRPTNFVELSDDPEAPTLKVHYQAPDGESARLRATQNTVRKVLRKLGCWVPPGMSHVRPMGASVHYSGTVPMKVEGEDWTTTPEGRCRPFENLYLADGSTFPFLPAKNLTFTLMANATRMAAADG